MEPSDSEECSEIEELLAQLEEERLLVELGRADNIQGPLSQDLEQRYEKLKAQSFGSHVNTKLDTLENRSSTLETEEESKGPSSPRIGKQEAGGDVAHANEVHLVDKESLSGNGLLANASKVAHDGDAAKKASFSIPHTSSLKLLHAHHQQEANDSMDPSPPVGGCSCFFLSSKWGEIKKQKKKPLKGGEGSWGSNHKDKTEQEEKIEEEWASVSTKNVGGGDQWWWDAHAGIFDVKRTEMEFKRVSMKEKKLTQEAQKLIEMASARSTTSPPHYYAAH